MALVILPIGLHRLGLDGPPVYDALPAAPVVAAESINFKTKDVDTLLGGMDPIDQQVQEALGRLRGSGAAVTQDGQRFLDVKKLDDSAPTLLEGEARTALARLVANGDITIESVRVEQDSSGQWGEVFIDLFNNRIPNSKKQTVKAPIRVEAKAT
jgi:hypothetical protein